MARMSFDAFLSAFHLHIQCRKVLTNDEIYATWSESSCLDVKELAARNDALAREYDQA